MPKTGYKHTEESKYKMKNTPKPRGKKSHRWRGGRENTTSGYILVYSPNHPFNRRKYVREHRLVMEKHLGRYLLPEEVVHHKNGVKTDNRIENLEIMTNSAHVKMHGLEQGRKTPTQRPPAVMVGQKWIDVLRDYRSYIVGKCAACKRLWWHRKDYPTKFCSSRCIENKTDNAKKLNRKYGYLGPVVRWKTNHKTRHPLPTEAHK